MNHAKHPRFVKDLPVSNLFLHAPDSPVAQMVAETLVYAGIDPQEAVYTNDGDRVRLLAIDHDHQFPIVGEVIDFHAETTWLARWSASGVYASSSAAARAKHSLKPNHAAGARLVEPDAGCGPKAEVGVAWIDECASIPPSAFEKAGRHAAAARQGPQSFLKAFKAAVASNAGEKFTEAELSDFVQIAIKDLHSKDLSLLQSIVTVWSQRHLHDEELRLLCKPLVHFDLVESALMREHRAGKIDRELFVWGLAAAYAVAGRLRVRGAPEVIPTPAMARLLAELHGLPEAAVVTATVANRERAAA